MSYIVSLSFVGWISCVMGGTLLFGPSYLSNDFANRDIEITTAGLALSMFPIGKVVSSMTNLPLFHLIGRKMVVFYSAVVLFITFWIIKLSVQIEDQTNYSVLIGVLRFIQGMMQSYSTVSIQSLVMMQYPDKQNAVVHAGGLGFGLGASGFTSIGALLYSYYGFEGPVMALAVCNFVSAILVLFFVSDTETT